MRSTASLPFQKSTKNSFRRLHHFFCWREKAKDSQATVRGVITMVTIQLSSSRNKNAAVSWRKRKHAQVCLKEARNPIVFLWFDVKNMALSYLEWTNSDASGSAGWLDSVLPKLAILLLWDEDHCPQSSNSLVFKAHIASSSTVGLSQNTSITGTFLWQEKNTKLYQFIKSKTCAHGRLGW